MRAFALLSFLCAGCAAENPSAVRDTTGAEMGWTCVYGGCTTVRESFSPPVPTQCGEDTALLVGAGALAILCAVSRDADGNDIVHERTCRPLACGDGLDCPQWESRLYLCSGGICQAEESLPLDRIDVASLCLWNVPRHASCPAADDDPEVDLRMSWVDAACDGTGCADVPPDCLAP